MTKKGNKAEENGNKETGVLEEMPKEGATEILTEEDRIKMADEKVEEYKNFLQRLQAEFDNYRKRTSEFSKTSRNDGICDVVMELLPAIDNLERGIAAVKDESAKSGMELILKQLIEILRKFDVCEIVAMNEEFNPDKHHAIAKEEGESDEIKVTEVFLKGYQRKTKVLRPAMVKVSNK